MTNPFVDGSGIAKVFAMAVKGTTRDAINKFAEKNGLNGPRLFHVLRVGAYGDQKWKYIQDADGNVKLISVVSKKAARPKAPAVSKAA